MTGAASADSGIPQWTNVSTSLIKAYYDLFVIRNYHSQIR